MDALKVAQAGALVMRDWLQDRCTEWSVTRQDHAMQPIRSVLVLGGGTAGYFVAIALKRRYSGLSVTLVDSPNIPIIGVGEATTTLLPPFLFDDLGIDPVALHEEVRPTFKLGIAFDGWGPLSAPRFGYPFGESEPLAASVHDASLVTQSLASLLMEDSRVPIARDADGSIRSHLTQMKFAYHLDNARFVAFLVGHAKTVGVMHRSAEIVEVRTDAGEITELVTESGEVLRADLYVDASGFRARLVGEALGSPFQSYASSLFCDSAVIGKLDVGRAIPSHTNAERMSSGWCWDISLEDSRHRGYVFASSFQPPKEAEAEFRARNPGLKETWQLRFQSGRRSEFLRGNAVAFGNAYGFVEPLESTALHMVILQIAWLAGMLGTATDDALPTHSPGDGHLDVGKVNAGVGHHWDYLRAFLALHYKLCTRADTPFWRACRERIDIAPLDGLIETFRREGVSLASASKAMPNDPAFGPNGLLTIVLGLDAIAHRPMTNVPREAWRQRVEVQREFVTRCMPHREALELLRERSELLHALDQSGSWCRDGHEFVRVGEDGHMAHTPHQALRSTPRSREG